MRKLTCPRRSQAYLQVVPVPPPADGHRNPRAAGKCSASIIIQNRAGAAALGEQRIVAVAEQVEVERLVGLLLVIAVDHDGDRLRRLPGAKVSVPVLATSSLSLVFAVPSVVWYDIVTA